MIDVMYYIFMNKKALQKICYLILLIQGGFSIKNKNHTPTKFSNIIKDTFSKNILIPSAIMLLTPKSVYAVKGAFELDAEFYLKELFKSKANQNNKIINSVGPLKYINPRTLDLNFAIDLNNCVIDAISTNCNISKIKFLKNVEENLTYSIKYFKSITQINSESLDDQFYFDMTLFLYYLEAGKMLPSSEERVLLRETVGNNIVNLLQTKYSIGIITNDATKTQIEQVANLGKFIHETLSLFRSKSIINGYNFDDENFYDSIYLSKSFRDKLPINFQILVENPSTIISFIEQYKLDTFYHPEVIGTTIRCFAKKNNLNLEFEDYLLDNVYRTDNFDVQAQDVVYECQLSI